MEERSGSEAERQVVGICLRYPDWEYYSVRLSGGDFTDSGLGRLFEACRLIPERPAPPDGTRPDFIEGLAGHIPMPAEWMSWLMQVENWRPRQAARLVQIEPAWAISLYESCGLLASLPRWAYAVENTAKLHQYRLACSYALRLVDEGAPAEDIKAVLSGMV